MSKMAQDR